MQALAKRVPSIDTAKRRNVLRELSVPYVAQLRLVWTRPLAEGIQEGTPLVHDGVMFFPNPNDITQAIDGVTGELLWEYRRKYPDDLNDR